MQELMAIWLICVLAGSSCAVFYTKSTDNDYPRVGRRAFFTRGDKGSSYPRIGRSSPSAPFQTDDAMSGYGDDHFRSLLKRGIYTISGGYPRVGRSEQGQELSAASLGSSAKAQDVVGGPSEERQYELPLGLMFFEFDKNGDKTLTREEFVEGMSRAREDGTACR
ncbi:HCS2 neuropeptides-like isoform X2 [Littorina saxatilis]